MSGDQETDVLKRWYPNVREALRVAHAEIETLRAENASLFRLAYPRHCPPTAQGDEAE